jgi:septum formation topological specificity factor MinE
MERPTKSRARFTLPDHDDARVHRVVEGLLSTPPEAEHPDRGKPRGHGGDPLAALVPRVDWGVELAAEERRRSRYGRPVSVVVVDVAGGRDPEALMRLAAGVLRRESREADRITRVGPRRFQVLLPETREKAATTYAERLRTAWQRLTQDAGAAAPDRLAVAVAGTRHAESVPEALERAIRQLA